MSETPSSGESTETPQDQDGPSPTPAPVQPTIAPAQDASEAAPEPAPDSEAEPAPAPIRRRRPRLAIALLLLFGLLAAGGGGAAIVFQLVRKPTGAEIDKAGVREVATRWQRLSAAEIFPERFVFGPQSDPTGKIVQIRRVGIATPAPCARTVDASIAAIFAKHRCETVLRATYLDPSGMRAVTVGVAVFPDTASADDASTDVNGLAGSKPSSAGLRMATFPGTSVERLDDASRQSFEQSTNHTPYLYLRVEEPLLPQGRLKPSDLVNLEFASDLVDRVMARLADDGTPCRRKDVRC